MNMYHGQTIALSDWFRKLGVEPDDVVTASTLGICAETTILPDPSGRAEPTKLVTITVCLVAQGNESRLGVRGGIKLETFLEVAAEMRARYAPLDGPTLPDPAWWRTRAERLAEFVDPGPCPCCDTTTTVHDPECTYEKDCPVQYMDWTHRRGILHEGD
jgi:hypothetical protein